MTREKLLMICKNIRDIGHLAWEAREVDDHDQQQRDELDRYRAVLEGAEYQHIEYVPMFSLEGCRKAGELIKLTTESLREECAWLRDERERLMRQLRELQGRKG